MKALSAVLLVGLAMCRGAQAQEWHTYTYPGPGFAIQFPAAPNVQTGKLKNSLGLTLPVTRYIVRQDGVEYTLSVVDYSSTNSDALSTIAETARSFSAKGKVEGNTGARVNGNVGRRMTITEGDASRSDIAIFFVDKHLYTAVGRALPPHAMDRSADTARFEESLQFLDEDTGLRALFGGGSRARSNAAATPPGSSSITGPNAARGSSGGSAEEHSETSANQRADAACAGKSPGDVVQLDTPTGPVPAICTLTARPIARH